MASVVDQQILANDLKQTDTNNESKLSYLWVNKEYFQTY